MDTLAKGVKSYELFGGHSTYKSRFFKGLIVFNSWWLVIAVDYTTSYLSRQQQNIFWVFFYIVNEVK